MKTPLGSMSAEFTARGLARLSFVRDGDSADVAPPGRGDGARLRVLLRELEAYFASGRAGFTVPLDLSSGTAFDQEVWGALMRIPSGETRTYGEVARAVGRPRAARAVGLSCGRNPVAVVVPCHRVTASRGPGGYGPGLALKRRLLELEGAC